MQLLRPDPEADSLPACGRYGFYPSSTHNFYNEVHRVPLNYKNCKTTVDRYVQTSTVNGSYQEHVVL